MNDLRVGDSQPKLPLSLQLCFVARTHANDLALHLPDEDFCNLHSWSAFGVWKKCCYNKDMSSIACMTEKPKELTGYKGKGYEMVYFENDSLNVNSIVSFWQQNDLVTDFFLSRNKWQGANWKTLGVGIYKGYVCVWMGTEPDPLAPPDTCGLNHGNSLPIATSIETMNSIVKYYLVYGSYNSQNEAKEAVSKLQKAGYTNTKMIKNNANYRVVLNEFTSLESALQQKERVKKVYKQVWLLKH
ncbi:MAG: SPOR domain-containing protein [Lentimicrobiaceae bacterium]|nr:SPOR domain-containing protein [Lentimicrobiaceae bacterium]